MTRDEAIALLLSRARHRDPQARAGGVTGAAQAIALYRLGVSAEGQLWSDLLSLGYTAERIGNLVYEAQLARMAWHSERILTLLRAALRAGHISHGQMVSRLIVSGWPVEMAQTLTQLEDIAPHPPGRQWTAFRNADGSIGVVAFPSPAFTALLESGREQVGGPVVASDAVEALDLIMENVAILAPGTATST